MTPEQRAREERCSICGSGEFASWECPQCARTVHEADAAALEQARKEGAEAVLSSGRQALEQACREGAAGEYRRGVEEMRRAIKRDLIMMPGSGANLNEIAASLLSAPEAGDRHREVREAFVEGVKARNSSACYGYCFDSDFDGETAATEWAEAEALRRWPLSAPGEVEHG